MESKGRSAGRPRSLGPTQDRCARIAVGSRVSTIAAGPLPSAGVDLDRFQQLIADTYLERDAARGVPATVAWLAEELGELAQAARKGSPAEQQHELGDVLAWLASLANQLDLSLADAARRYAGGCPRCAAQPCAC